MGTQYLNTQVRLKRGTAEAWSRNNPILERGEPGWATDSKVLKIGDGETHWNDLTYVVNVSDYVTEQELRDAINKYDEQVGAAVEDILYEIGQSFDQVYDDINALGDNVQTKFEDIETAIGNIGSMTSSHEVALKNSIEPTLETHTDQLDRLAGSVNYTNCLRKYNPSYIKMEYTNRAGGWKASIKDENTGEEIHGASLFTRHNIDGWQEHSIEFVNDSTTNATFQIYSVSKEPGVVQIDDIEICDMYGGQAPGANGHDDFDSGWTFPSGSLAWNDHGQAIIRPGKTGWFGYAERELSGLVVGGMYVVGIDISKVNSGGVNFKIVDGNGAKITLLDIGKTRTGKYFSTAGRTTLYFIATTVSATLSLSSSGDQIDDLVISTFEVYRNEMESWSKTELMDHGWTQPEDWYTWGKTVEYEGEKAVRFSTSSEKKYYYTKRRVFTFDLRSHYYFKFDAKCVSGGLNVSMKDQNGQTLARQTISPLTAPEWTRFEMCFAPTTEGCTLSIQAFGDQTLLYDVYMKNLSVMPLMKDENILPNGDFSIGKYNDGVLYPGKANWTLGKASSIVDDTVQLAVQDGNTSTYVPGCSQDITLIPGRRYRISFKSKSIEHTPMWMPYTTFTNEDKIAFVSDWKPSEYEDLIFGGPWIKGSAEHYAARVTIEGNMPINAKYLCIDAGIWGAGSFEVDVKIKQYGELIYFSRYELVPLPHLPGAYSKFYLPLPKDFIFGNNSIELTFMVNEIDNSECSNQIRSINLLGNFAIANYEPNPDYYVLPDGRMVAPTIIADRVITNIDDGSLDWEV